MSETDEVLRDIRRWVKIIGLQEARPLLTEALTDEDGETQKDLRITYHLTDGDHGRRDIEDYISYSRGWVGDRHTEWSNIGLIEMDDSTGSYRHVIGLKEAGIDVPDIPDPEDETGDQ